MAPQRDGQSFLSDDEAILAEFIEESVSSLENIPAMLVELEANPSAEGVLNAVFRPIHSIKGNSAFLGLLNCKALAHELESVLDAMRRGRLTASRESAEVLMDGVLTLRRLLGRVRPNEDQPDDRPGFDFLLSQLAAVCAGGLIPRKTRPPASDATAPTAEETAVRTVRVPEKTLGTFLAVAAELDAVHADIQGLRDGLPADPATRSIGQRLQTANERMGAAASLLGQTLRDLTSTPAARLFERAPLIVRHLAAALEKDVRLRIEGEQLLLPKSLVQALEAPILHLLRNAVDHGIETPAAREQAGKKPFGTIRIQAVEEKDGYVFRVADDGKGIDYKAVLGKAMLMGLCPRSGRLTPEEVNNLLFLPGLSTAATVTEVSGRGVGMDVVKSTVEGLGGSIAIGSQPGKGAEFQIRIPKTAHMSQADTQPPSGPATTKA